MFCMDVSLVLQAGRLRAVWSGEVIDEDGMRCWENFPISNDEEDFGRNWNGKPHNTLLHPSGWREI